MIGYDPENSEAVYKKAVFIVTKITSWGEQLAGLIL